MGYPTKMVFSLSLIALSAAQAGEPLIILKPGQTMANIHIRQPDPVQAAVAAPVVRPASTVLTIPAIRSNQEIVRQDNFIEIGKPRTGPAVIPAPAKADAPTNNQVAPIPLPQQVDIPPPAESRVAQPVPGVNFTRYYIDTTPKSKKQKQLAERSAKALQQQKLAQGPVEIAPAKDRKIEVAELAGSIESEPVMRMPSRTVAQTPSVAKPIVTEKPIITAAKAEPSVPVVAVAVQPVKPLAVVESVQAVAVQPVVASVASAMPEPLPVTIPLEAPAPVVAKPALPKIEQAPVAPANPSSMPWALIAGLGGGGLILVSASLFTFRRKEKPEAGTLDWYDLMEAKKNGPKIPVAKGGWDFDAV